MAFRSTKGIVTDTDNAPLEADVIMTAAVLGFSAWQLGDPADKGSTLKPIDGHTGPVQFDIDPSGKDAAKDLEALTSVAKRVQRAVGLHLGVKDPKALPEVTANKAPAFNQGAVIMGVYKAAGQTHPALSDEGVALWAKISKNDPSIKQYVGRGAYTGLVDDPANKKILAGPLSTARFHVPADSDKVQRWLPAKTSALWAERARKDKTHAAWGLITGGKKTGEEVDAVTHAMTATDGMVFNPADIADTDVAAYTHGMIQAIYLAYGAGPSCYAYEIAVGTQTTKMASCFPCTMFMASSGYPPNSIHLGRGESWTPLYAPYKVGAHAADAKVIADLNNTWSQRCLLWLERGLTILGLAGQVSKSHEASLAAVLKFVEEQKKVSATVGSTLILDAVTIHDSETARLDRTLAA